MLNSTKEQKVFRRLKRWGREFKSPYTPEVDRGYREVRERVCGYKAPSTAYTRQYFDKKCPFTGDVRVTGKIFKAKVKKMSVKQTIVVVVEYLYYVSKYKRFQRRHTNFSVHVSPCFDGMIGISDTVICGETRPLSKTISSVALGVIKSGAPGTFKRFDGI